MLKKNLLLPALSLLSLFLIFLLFSTYSKVNDQKKTIEQLKAVVDSLSRHCPPDNSQLPGLTQWEKDRLEEAGISKEKLFEDLKERTDLIPYEGQLGGTMFFPSEEMMWLLVHPWVLAYFEDGHSAGYLLLEYKHRDGEITWEVLLSQLK